MMWLGQFEVKFFGKALHNKKKRLHFSMEKKTFHFDDENCNFRIQTELAWKRLPIYQIEINQNGPFFLLTKKELL